MYHKILVAYDGSKFSDVALRKGSELARLCNAELSLVGIVATTPYMAFAEGTAGIDIWGMERKQLEQALKSAVRELSDQGLNASASIREGNPANEIADCAVEQKADLVILGHSDKGVMARWFEDSVGEGLVRNLSGDLLIATN